MLRNKFFILALISLVKVMIHKSLTIENDGTVTLTFDLLIQSTDQKIYRGPWPALSKKHSQDKFGEWSIYGSKVITWKSLPQFQSINSCDLYFDLVTSKSNEITSSHGPLPHQVQLNLDIMFLQITSRKLEFSPNLSWSIAEENLTYYPKINRALP